VDLRGAPEPVADRGTQAIGRVRCAQIRDAGLARERGQRGERDVLAPAGEQGEHLLDPVELRGHAAGGDEAGEGERRDGLARGLARVGHVTGRRAARRARHEVELEPRQPHHGAEVALELSGVVTARLVLREVDDAGSTEQRQRRHRARSDRLCDERPGLAIDAGIAERAGRFVAEQAARDDEVDVEITGDIAGELGSCERQLAVQPREQGDEARLELLLLDPLEQPVVRRVDRVEDAVDGDIDRQLRLIDLVIGPRVARLREPRRCEEAIALEPALLLGFEPEPALDQRESSELRAAIPHGGRGGDRRRREREERGLGSREVRVGDRAAAAAFLPAFRRVPVVHPG
jgi:hypothetical protein